MPERHGEHAFEVSYEELIALLDGDLSQAAEHDLRTRIALDPLAETKLAALRAVDRASAELRAAYCRRVAEHPEPTSEDLEMSDDSASRIITRLRADLARGDTDQD